MTQSSEQAQTPPPICEAEPLRSFLDSAFALVYSEQSCLKQEISRVSASPQAARGSFEASAARLQKELDYKSALLDHLMQIFHEVKRLNSSSTKSEQQVATKAPGSPQLFGPVPADKPSTPPSRIVLMQADPKPTVLVSSQDFNESEVRLRFNKHHPPQVIAKYRRRFKDAVVEGAIAPKKENRRLFVRTCEVLSDREYYDHLRHESDSCNIIRPRKMDSRSVILQFQSYRSAFCVLQMLSECKKIGKVEVLDACWSAEKPDEERPGPYVKVFTSTSHGQVFETPDMESVVRKIFGDFQLEEVKQVRKAFYIKFTSTEDANIARQSLNDTYLGDEHIRVVYISAEEYGV